MEYGKITKSIQALVSSLDNRKGRRKAEAFKAEGTKCVADTLGHYVLRGLFASESWISAHPNEVSAIASHLVYLCKRADLIEMTNLSTAPDVIAVYNIPKTDFADAEADKGLMLALDTIQDPGNLGTIIRVADWFGVKNILCSNETADCYAPKVVQSTMGSISRVKLHYGNLQDMFERLKPSAVYGTFLDGNDIGNCTLGNAGIIVIGNEGNGISSEVARLVTDRLFIPSFPPGAARAESLNAAVATAITLAKFRGV